MKPFKVLVCGGRNYNNKKLLYATLDNLGGAAMGDQPNPSWLPRGDITIISGGAKGADTLAEDWATINLIPIERYPAEWDKYGKSAGYIRNKQMLEEGKPDLVIAFPGGRGTQNMIDIARKATVAVEIINEADK